MMCVHGISLKIRCSCCDGVSSMACPGPGEYAVPGKLGFYERRFVNAAAFHASSANDRLATEIAFLTRSIQGLMSREELVRDDIGKVICESMRQSKQPSRHVEAQMEVKRGPVTDGEIKNLMSSAGMTWGPKGKTSLRYKIMMQEFAKSRGLID